MFYSAQNTAMMYDGLLQVNKTVSPMFKTIFMAFQQLECVETKNELHNNRFDAQSDYYTTIW